MTLASRLPAFTWDRIAPLREKAGLHPDGLVDLSMGTPVDPVPDLIRGALAEASNAPGYPATWGTPRLRSAAAGWLARAHGVCVPPDDVLPVIGTKEFIAWLPVMLGLGPGDVVVHPELAYPTYDIGARLAGATAVAVGQPAGGSWVGPGPGQARVGELAVQPDRAGAAPRAPAQGGGMGQGTRGGGGVRRVLHLAGLGSLARLRAAPRRVRPVAGRRARRSFAVQAVQPGRLPGRVRDRRRGAGRGPAGDQQASRDDHAGAGAGCDDGRARRRRARLASSGSVMPPGELCCGRPSPRPAGPSTTPRPGCTCGSRTRRTTAGPRPNGWPPRLASWSPLASSTGPAGARHVRVALTATDERIAAAAKRLAALRS